MKLKITMIVLGITGSIILFGVIPFAFAQQTPITVETVKVDATPKVDGEGGDEAWQKAQEFKIQTADGPEVMLKSVYTDKEIFFLLNWADESESISMDMWVLQDGTWSIKQEARYGGAQSWDADQDRLAFQWNIRDSVTGFNEKGCIALCHVEEREDRMHTNGPGQHTDIWQWKAAHSNPLGKMDNGYLDDTVVSRKDVPDEEERLYAAHKWDGEGNPFVRNMENNAPKWMPKDGPNNDPFLFKDQTVPLDPGTAKSGATIPGWILENLPKGRDIIDAKGIYKDGAWTLEIGRSLVTEHKDTDIQFDDLTKPYYFGMGVWENDRMFGHMRADGPYMLIFKQ